MDFIMANASDVCAILKALKCSSLSYNERIQNNSNTVVFDATVAKDNKSTSFNIYKYMKSRLLDLLKSDSAGDLELFGIWKNALYMHFPEDPEITLALTDAMNERYVNVFFVHIELSMS
jgi:hypothetical protein